MYVCKYGVFYSSQGKSLIWLAFFKRWNIFYEQQRIMAKITNMFFIDHILDALFFFSCSFEMELKNQKKSK